MLPLLLVIPGAWLLWTLAKKHGAKEAEERRVTVAAAVEEALARRGGARSAANVHALPAPAAHQFLQEGPRMFPHREDADGLPTVASYMDHLREASLAAAALNVVRPAAINADMAALTGAPHEAVQALAILSQPIDTLTVQRDLNLLGARPALPETGVSDRATSEAIKALQQRFKQPPTGVVDPGTAVAIRYSVGVINLQNQMGAVG